MARIPVGLSMFTLRDEAAVDFQGTMHAVAEMGYDGVEVSPPKGMTARELKHLLDELGMTTPGGHTGLEALEADLHAVVDFNLEVGAQYVTIPSMPQDRRDSADAWRRAAHDMTRIGEDLASHGLALCYHNHSFEFTKYDGRYGFDIFYEESDPRFVKSELDTYWVNHGGEDPAEYIERLSGRVPLLHIKDMAPDGAFAEVGEGTLDWNGIFSASEAHGVAWYLVEQDTCQGPPIASVRTSIGNLRKMGKVL